MDTEKQTTLPERTTHIRVDDRDIYLVGTAHISRESVEDVRTTIEAVHPDSVCVELCKARHQAMTQTDNWRKMDVFKVVRQKKAVFLLAQLMLSSFYRRLGEKLGVQPGAEMLEGVRLAEQTGAELVLADRDIEITLKRVWGFLGFFSKLKLVMHFLMSLLFVHEEIDEEMIERLKKQDQLEAAMAELAEQYPQIKTRLIDERDTYLAERIRTAPGKTVVAVVGAGHVDGIREQVHQPQSLEELRQIPRRPLWPTLVKWGIPLLVLGFIAYGFRKGVSHGVESIYIWVLVNGIFSAAGAALAFAHPLAVVTAFLAAPLTSLNPMLAAGWFAGIAQALIKKPQVSNLEDLPEAIRTWKGFWTNPVTRILLVVALANIGSVIGTWVGGIWIGARSV
jgi:pheromone shutdown-related protein TraB